MNFASLGILFVFFGYTAISWGILGPFDSISATWYAYKERNFSSAFNIFGFLAFAGCCLEYYYVHHELTALFFVLSGACMWFLTVASVYKQYNMHHIIPTLASIAFGFAAVYAEFGWGPRFWHPLWIFTVLAAMLKVFNVPYSTTWAELLVVGAILANFIFVN